MEETTNSPVSPRDESGGNSPHVAGAQDTPDQPQSPAAADGSQAPQDTTSARQDNRPHDPEIDALIDAAVVLLSGWASLGLRFSKLLLREGARSLEQGARVLQSLATVIEKKFENPVDSGPSGT